MINPNDCSDQIFFTFYHQDVKLTPGSLEFEKTTKTTNRGGGPTPSPV